MIGHSGPVFAVSFSPDKYYLVSGSEDGTGYNQFESKLSQLVYEMNL